ncbi:MAG TPA: O-antigen ligase family protein [Bradyrhizobium sp.]|nr:O-antigen ligase family protein [Bradyrhizobium sp.]
MTMDRLSRNLGVLRQGAAILTAFALPLSTSAEAIAVSIFALLALLTLDRARLAATFRAASALLPLALFLLMLASLLWSAEPLARALKGVDPYAKLLLIPLVMATAFTPRQALQIGYGFLAACLIVLALSWASLLWPSGPWDWFRATGVPVKDNAVQSGCFALSAFGFAIHAIRIWSRGDARHALAMIVLALLFFFDIFFIAVSKTGLLMALALLALVLVHVGGWRRALLIAVPAVLVIAVVLWSSAAVQMRMAEFSADMRGEQSDISTDARLDFWKKAVGFVEQAPLLGHGAGSIEPLYQSLEATRPSPIGLAVRDPHDQFFAVALQAGLVGGVLLLAMWAVHLMMFTGRDFARVLGQAIVLQNVIGSLFNSHLSAVTQGMLYCLAVGLLGAVIRNAHLPDRLAAGRLVDPASA